MTNKKYKVIYTEQDYNKAKHKVKDDMDFYDMKLAIDYYRSLPPSIDYATRLNLKGDPKRLFKNLVRLHDGHVMLKAGF